MQQKTHTQKGFTLIELMIVVVVLAILASVGLKGYSSWVRSSNVDVAAYFVERDFLSAATQCFRTNRSYSSCNKTQLTNYGLSSNTPWDTSWNVSVSGNSFSLTIPVSDSVAGQNLATRLSASQAEHIGTASFSSPNVTVAMTMP